MANGCSFELHAKGPKEGLEALRKGFLDKTAEEKFHAYDVFDISKSKKVFKIRGYCKWSVQGPLLTDMNAISKEYNDLEIEIYSEECGCQFMEHYRWKDGILLENTSVSYLEAWVEDIFCMTDTEIDNFFNQQICKQHNVNKSNYTEFVEDGYLRIGGMKWDFEVK